MPLLENFVDRDKRFVGLDLIRKDWLDAKSGPEGDGRVVIPGVHDALWVMSSQGKVHWDLGMVHILRTCFCLGAVSSALVAFFMLTISSCSALSLSTGRVG